MSDDKMAPGYAVRAAQAMDLAAARALMIRTFEEDFGYGYTPEFMSMSMICKAFTSTTRATPSGWRRRSVG
jgi:hypothetical protein